MTRYLAIVLGMTLISLLGLSSPTQASSITYSETFTASGTLGFDPLTHPSIESFADRSVTITLAGDTEDVYQNGPIWLNVGTAAVTIDGVGTAALTGANDPLYGVISGINLLNVTIVRFVSPNIFIDIVGLNDPNLPGYDLKSPLEPLVGGLALGVVSLPTTLGGLTFLDVRPGVTLSATVEATPVPEPTSLMLTVTGLVGIVRGGRSRKAVQRFNVSSASLVSRSS